MKRIKKSNFRVEVIPGFYEWRLTGPVEKQEEYQMRECTDLLEEIQRHIPEADNARAACDTEAVCEYCDSIWEEPPWCCSKAQDEWEKEHPDAYKEVDADAERRG